MIRVEVRHEVSCTARERAGLTVRDRERRIPKLERRERDGARPTRKQLEGLAKALHAAVDSRFLPEPPIERVPVPGFPTMGNALVGHPKADPRGFRGNQRLGQGSATA